jgi:hypothetical protein
MSLKASELIPAMTKAAKDSLSRDWPKAKDYAASEMKRLAQSLVDIARLAAQEKINKQQARALLRIHKNTTEMVLLTIEGLGIIAVENAINASLAVVKDAVNNAAGLIIL